MRFKNSAIGLAVTLAFGAGIVVAPLLPQALKGAHAADAPMAPQVIDLAALKIDDLPKTSNPLLRTQTLVSTVNGTVSVQTGNVAKHMHEQSDEMQYIIEGSGSMWVGNERKTFKPGTLIIIPRGTAHGGAITDGPYYKALAIKLPPAVAGDSHHVD